MLGRMRIHLMGICGTGMGSLAGLLVQAGHKVQGSDEHVYPPMSTMLAGLGIDIKQGYRAENLDGGVTAWSRAGLPLVAKGGGPGRVI